MYLHLILLIDASGSMSPYITETRQTIHSIIKELDKDTHFTLVFFDTTEYKIVADNYVRNIGENIGELYNALGGTPIADSLYKAIQDITKELDDIQYFEEKHKIIVFTDGQENSSHYVGAQELGCAVQHMTENFNWEFKFLGPKAEQKTLTEYTESIKIKKENVTLYSDVSSGLKEMKELVVA